MAVSMKDKISSYIAGESSDETTKEIAKEISKNNVKFLEFIDDLGESLTNVETVARGRATRLIGDVIKLLPQSFLSSDQVELVATFLIAKLSDHHSVQPDALQTLAVLTSHTKCLPKGLPQLICRSIFREVQNQTLSQSDRFATYTVLQNIIGRSFEDVEEMGGDFVIGFIQQFDAEKDPRNLMIAFNCAQFISSNLNLGPFIEEMFEVLGCYFPIDFTPPPNNANSITKEDLIIALRKCFAATVDFAPFSVPLLVEKMTSDLQSARTDAYLTMTEAAPVYGRNGIADSIGSIVSCVKREVLMNLSTELVEAAKGCLVAVFTAMMPKDQVDTSKDDAMSRSAVELYQDICKFLEGSDIPKACLAYSLCAAVASSSSSAFSIMAPLVLPALILQTKNQSQVTSQLSYLTELSAFVKLLVKFSFSLQTVNAVSELINSMCGVMEEILRRDVSDLQSQTVQSLCLLCQTEQLSVPDDKCVSYLKLVVSQAMHSTDQVQRKMSLLCVNGVVQNRSSSIRADITEFVKAAFKSEEADFAGEALVATTTDVNSYTDVNKFFLEHISQNIADTKVVIATAKCVYSLLSQHVSDNSIVAVVLEQTGLPMVRLTLTCSCQWNHDSQDEATQLLEVIKDIMKILSCNLQKGDITKMWDAMQKLYLTGDVHSFGLPGDFTSLAPLQLESTWQQTRLIAFLEGFMEGVNIQWTVENREVVFETLFGFSLASQDQFSQLAACKVLALMVNKAPLGAEIHWFLEAIIDKSKSAMSDISNPLACQRALTLWVWLTKALECRTHSAASLFSTHLISMVSDPHLGSAAAEGLGHVLEDRGDMFKAHLKGITSPLYKQRFFTLNLKQLLEGCEKAKTQEIKQNHLKAISLMTSHLPLQVLKPHLSLLVPLLLLSLTQTSDDTLSHTLLTLSAAVTSTPDFILPHLDSVINYLLKIARENSCMKVRASSVKCLGNLSSLDVVAIGKYQTRVVKDLGAVVDDRKRLVRKQAVEARNAWILLENTK